MEIEIAHDGQSLAVRDGYHQSIKVRHVDSLAGRSARKTLLRQAGK
jgi:hypothetical protein